MSTAGAALDRLCDPAAEVSAHYLIEEDGTLWSLVPEAERAWHAGRSHWRGRERLNDVSIGVELVNPGHAGGLQPFPEPQLETLLVLAHGLLSRWPIAAAGGLVSHSEVAPERKLDPGERFPWRRLAEAGLGLWPEAAPARPPDPAAAGQLLARIGFRPSIDGPALARALAAFQRRYRPWRVDGRLDPETMGRLEAVAGLLERSRGTI